MKSFHKKLFFFTLKENPVRNSDLPLFCFSESDSASWEIDQVTLKDEDYYECIAISTAGTGRARTFLDVSGNQISKRKKNLKTFLKATNLKKNITKIIQFCFM